MLVPTVPSYADMHFASPQREVFHLPDGEAQQQRDAVFAAAMVSGPTPAFSSRWYAETPLICA
jgi:hypothetical protein